MLISTHRCYANGTLLDQDAILCAVTPTTDKYPAVLVWQEKSPNMLQNGTLRVETETGEVAFEGPFVAAESRTAMMAKLGELSQAAGATPLTVLSIADLLLYLAADIQRAPNGRLRQMEANLTEAQQQINYWMNQYRKENQRLNEELHRQADPSALPLGVQAKLKADAERISDLENAYQDLKHTTVPEKVRNDLRTKIGELTQHGANLMKQRDELKVQLTEAERRAANHTSQLVEFVKLAGTALGIKGEAFKQYGWLDISKVVTKFANAHAGILAMVAEHQWNQTAPDRFTCLCGGIYQEKQKRCGNHMGCWVEGIKDALKG